MTAPIRSMPELIQALRNRRDELQLTHETLDDISLLPDGYTSKLFAPVPMKNLGPKSFEAILEALGLVVVVMDDPKVSNRVKTKWENKRERPLRRQLALPAPESTLSLDHQVPMEITITPVVQRLLENPDWMKQIGSRGGKASWQLLTPEERFKVMRRRWKKRKAQQRLRKATVSAQPTGGATA